MAIEFPEKLQCLFHPKRYKVLYGGRGGAKSWGVARALLLLGTQKPLRVLCAREMQKSLDDSVKKLLEDQITELGLTGFYEIQKAKIFGRPGTPAEGTEFAFEGLYRNVNGIRSYEGVDICWVEEAANVSKDSWLTLIPTIRKPGSEIWLTFNPNEEEDYTYQEFVVRRKPDSFVVKINWRDNPWFPDTLRKELAHDRATNYDNYLHVWEGQCKLQLDGVVYANEIREMIADDRVTYVPAERAMTVDTYWDLGKSDYTAIWFGQTVAMQGRVVDFHEDNRKEIDDYAKVLQNKPYPIGTLWLPHDAAAKKLGMKLTIEEQLVNIFGRDRVKIVPNIRIHEGINLARQMMSNLWVDAERCAAGWAHIRKYSYRLKSGTNVFGNEPMHNEHSHAGDAWRYMAIARQRSKTLAVQRAEAAEARSRLGKMVDRIGSSLDWMGR